MKELKAKLKKTYPTKTTLTDEDRAYVAVAYNAGRANLDKDFRKQGHKSDDGRFYGENFWQYLQLSKTVPAAP